MSSPKARTATSYGRRLNGPPSTTTRSARTTTTGSCISSTIIAPRHWRSWGRRRAAVARRGPGAGAWSAGRHRRTPPAGEHGQRWPRRRPAGGRRQEPSAPGRQRRGVVRWPRASAVWPSRYSASGTSGESGWLSSRRVSTVCAPASSPAREAERRRHQQGPRRQAAGALVVRHRQRGRASAGQIVARAPARRPGSASDGRRPRSGARCRGRTPRHRAGVTVLVGGDGARPGPLQLRRDRSRQRGRRFGALRDRGSSSSASTTRAAPAARSSTRSSAGA